MYLAVVVVSDKPASFTVGLWRTPVSPWIIVNMICLHRPKKSTPNMLNNIRFNRSSASPQHASMPSPLSHYHHPDTFPHSSCKFLEERKRFSQCPLSHRGAYRRASTLSLTPAFRWSDWWSSHHRLSTPDVRWWNNQSEHVLWKRHEQQ